jgi:hypothetical protein
VAGRLQMNLQQNPSVAVQFTPSERGIRGITWYDTDLDSLSPIAKDLPMPTPQAK